MKKSKKTQKNQDTQDQLKRALADYANLQRRIEQDKLQIADHLKSMFIVKLLPVLNNLEVSLKVLAKEASAGARQGLEISINQFKKILYDWGVAEIKTEGEFDPQLHEAIEVVEGKEENKITQVLEKGYRLGDKILRPARVKVEKRKIETKTN